MGSGDTDMIKQLLAAKEDTLHKEA